MTIPIDVGPSAWQQSIIGLLKDILDELRKSASPPEIDRRPSRRYEVSASTTVQVASQTEPTGFEWLTIGPGDEVIVRPKSSR